MPKQNSEPADPRELAEDFFSNTGDDDTEFEFTLIMHAPVETPDPGTSE